MKNRAQINNQLKTKYPIWGYNPKGLEDPSLAVELSLKGAVGLLDLENISEEKCMNLLNRCSREINKQGVWGVRLTDVNHLNFLPNNIKIPIVIVNFEPTQNTIAELKKKCDFLIAEVCYFEEAQLKSSWSDLFLVKGFEAGGKIGEHTSFILIQKFYESGFPFIVQGGFGIYNIIAALIGGATGIVLDGVYGVVDRPGRWLVAGLAIDVVG